MQSRNILVNIFRSAIKFMDTHKNVGNHIYDHFISLVEFDKVSPNLEIRTKMGKKRFVRRINDFVRRKKKKLDNLKLVQDSSKADVIKFIQDHSTSPKDFSKLVIKDVRLSDEIYKEIVVFASDLGVSISGSYKYIIFSTKGKIEVFSMAYEMSKWNNSLTIQVDCTGSHGICFIQLGITDFKSEYYSPLYGAINSKNAETTTKISK